MTEAQYYGLSGRSKNEEEKKLKEIKTYLNTEIDFAEDMIIEATERKQEAYYEGYSRALIRLRKHFFKEVK